MSASELDFTDDTVDELKFALDSTAFSLDELRTIREYETDSADPRSTALDAIDEKINEKTSGPDEPAGDEEESEYNDDERFPDGAGATEAGVPGVDLPNPYGDDAPATLRIFLPVAMAVGGVMFDDDGRQTIAYATPNDADVSGMRVKRTLESATNRARLARTDPLHPRYEG